MDQTTVQATLAKLKFEKRHSGKCMEKYNLKNCWEELDNRKHCFCPYSSRGVHDRVKGYQSLGTGEVSLDRARAVVKLRLEIGNLDAKIPDHQGIPIQDAISDFMESTRDAGVKDSTMAKYETLMSQLQAFTDWKGIRFLHELNQDVILMFRRSWEDPDAGYKVGTKWSTQSVGTAKRNAKTLKYFFNRCMEREWITKNPTSILKFPKSTGKMKEEVKYLTPAQFEEVLAACGDFTNVTEYNSQRLKVLILLMRWTGLRISDAVVLKSSSITNDMLQVRTKKASTQVLIPIHDDLKAGLAQLTPYPDGYLFWNRRDGKRSTVQGNFGVLMAQVFDSAGIKSDSHHISHQLRNTFAVDLLEKGVPLETVSLLLGHQSVSTTEKYYSDFTVGYMEKAAEKVRAVWEQG